ncbi:thiocyanate hydrolase [Mycobacterium intracellulare]|uniref:thiocyanate hydrolase n=1 Tax=Mycobacterium intracellulare TaxID=1767 RepID=UPI001EEF5014|nr:thiocyanate hydrolase [Mycobacterium intracellulare]MEE3752870.1 thiocyanate hydrolase [Mycobacterium intracellulare]
MSTAHTPRPIAESTVAPLTKIVERNQVWSRMAAKYGVDNPVPPWQTSLDGICDAIDQSRCGAEALGFAERREDEDTLSATVYAELPYPENRLVALAHSLVARGVIDESELEARLAAVRARLES